MLAIAGLAVGLPAAAAKPQLLRVLTSGSTDRWSGGSQHFSYGVVLHNTSKTRDAVGVQMHVAAMGRNGVIGIYLTTIPRIPAGGTFYAGNEPVTIGNDQRATSIVVGVAVSGTVAPRGPLPPGAASIVGGRVVGSVRNPAGRALITRSTRIFAVYFDRAGKVIGGVRLSHLRFPHHARIAPHAKAAFTAAAGAAVPTSRIASVKISVVPTYAD